MTVTKPGFIHFQDLTGCHKALYTMTLLILGVAYLFAMVQTFSVHANRDGSPGLSPRDLVVAYSGAKDITRMEAAITGPMSGMLHKEDIEEMVLWIQDGAKEGRYQEKIIPIMEEHCYNCHGDSSESRTAYPHNPVLEGYSKIMQMVEIDTGADILTLVRVSHIHLFGMTFIFFLVGTIFLHAYLQSGCLKCIILITPFVAILLDIFSWYLTKLYEPFAWIIYISGVFMALSFAAQWIISMYQMWFCKSPCNATEERCG